VWVADVSASRRAGAEQEGVPRGRTVSDFREALAAVDIVTPADCHREIAGACLAAGRPCFVEKPLSVSG
jgi:predicted dehydrogenase